MSRTEPAPPELDLAREELREGIENSRVLVRQSRILIELSESHPAAPGGEDDSGPAH